MPKYRTMQGKEIDMDKLVAQNELMPAIGNMKVNARGDELGPGGKIVRKREDIIAAYYESNPKSRANRVVEKTEISKVESKTTNQNQKTKKSQVNNNEG